MLTASRRGQSPEMQVRELREHCERRGWEIAGKYVDAGISGAKDSRPELNRMVADAHRRRFDAVVLWKFDRFARSVSHPLRALETFNALGVAFVSRSEQMNTSTPTGKMVFTVLVRSRNGSARSSPSAFGPDCGMLAPRDKDWVVRKSEWTRPTWLACEPKAAPCAKSQKP